MITEFKHKGLERFFLRGTRAGIQPRHAARLHRPGTWAVKVSANWRVTFVFRGEDAESVDYEDYH